MLSEPPGAGGAAGRAPHAVVVGSPVAHSLSPLLHRAAWQDLGLGAGSYERVEVPAGELAQSVVRLHSREQVTALSVTMPLKEEALALGLAGAGASEVAVLAGGANTLVLDGDGWAASNTDVPALARVIGRACGQQSAPGADPAAPHESAVVPGEVVLLGSGATARSGLLALHRCGAREVTVAVRDAVRRDFSRLADELGIRVAVVRLDALAPTLREATAAPGSLLVVNTLPAGWWETLAAPAWAHGGRAHGGLHRRDAPGPDHPAAGVVWVDAQYAGWPHPWAAAAEDAGAQVLSGLHMLVEQAVDQVELMTGLRPTAEGTASLLPPELRALHRV